jgi:SAM-dependent methyltransferase
MDLKKYYREYTGELGVVRTFFGDPLRITAPDLSLPSVVPLEDVHFVLDIGCGTGEWARSLVSKYPHIQVVGIDTSHRLLREAISQTLAEGLRSLSFFHFDVALPLNFLCESYDLVHLHSLTSFIITSMSDKILDEAIRVLKPGGWLNILDYEQGSTSSDAFNCLMLMALKSIASLGSSLAPSSSKYGVAARLYGFLVDAGMIDVSYTVRAVDYSINGRPPGFINDLVAGLAHFKPLILMLDQIDSKGFDLLIEQVKEELSRPASCGYAYLISTVGRKTY